VKIHSKMMDIFTHSYDPAEWDPVSSRSEAEYFSITESSDSDIDNSIVNNVNKLAISNSGSDLSSTDEIDFLSIPDIKMMCMDSSPC
jgi:hypothetical protein